jgi:predicted DNA binding CopG/RHH family protein
MKKSNGKKRNREQDLLAEGNEWETGKRGSHSTAATDNDEADLEKAMELQMISIRLPESVVEKLKTLAKKEGIGYQPYTRQVLIHHTQGDSGVGGGKLHDLEKRLKSVEKAVFKKTAGR